MIWTRAVAAAAAAMNESKYDGEIGSCCKREGKKKKKLTILKSGCHNRASDVSPSVRTCEKRTISRSIPEFCNAQTCVGEKALTDQNDAGIRDNP